MDTTALMCKGYAAVKAKRCSKALRIGNRLVELGHSSGYEILALAYAGLGRREEAISTLEKGVAAAPSVWLLWELLGNNYSEQRRYADAQRCYATALTCPQVDVSYVYLNSTVAFVRERQFTSALQALDQVTSARFADNVLALRTKISQAQERQGMPSVWFFLIEVSALPGGDMYVPGSLALLQCCVPAHRLEDALPALDIFLSDQHFERVDLIIARRYDPADPDEEPPETARHALLEAAKTNMPVIALFIEAATSAQHIGEVQPVKPPPARRRNWWPF